MRVETKNGMPRFIYEPPVITPVVVKSYMSSGAYKLGYYNIVTPSGTTDVTLYKSSSVSTLESSVLTPLFNPVPPNNGAVSKIYNLTKKAEMPLALMKNEMTVKRPSEFSGLMRRMVQGRYGVGKTTPNLGDQGDPVPFGTSFSRTSGVVRFGTLYFLVAMESSENLMTVKAYPLSIPSKYISLMATEVGDEHAALETLALANATTVKAAEFVVTAYTIPSGEPVHYGWNFSLTTNQADIVIRYNPGYSYDRNTWSHLRATFTYNGSLSCSCEIVEQVDGWMLSARSPVWIPGGAVMNWVNVWSSTPSPTSAQNFPVYAYYVADSLKLVRWRFSNTNTEFNAAAWGAQTVAAGWTATVFGEGSSSFDTSMDYGDLMSHGFHFPGGGVISTVEHTIRRSGTISFSYDTPLPVVGLENVSVGSTAYLAMGATYTDYNPMSASGPLLGYSPGNPFSNSMPAAIATDATGTTVQIDSNDTGSHMTCLIVPASDCSAVYIGSYVSRSAIEYNVTNTQLKNSSNTARSDEFTAAVVGGKWVAVAFVGSISRQFSMSGTFQYGGGTTVSTSAPIGSDVFNMVFHGSLDVDVGAVDSVIFRPSVVTPYYNHKVEALSGSIFTESRYNVGALTETEVVATGGYPIDIDLFIGAA